MTTIELPDELTNELQDRVTGTEFDSVEEYVLFVLREVVAETPELGQMTSSGRTDEVREQLKSLGYLE